MKNEINRILVKIPKSDDEIQKILEDFWEKAYEKGLEDGRCEACKDIAWQIERGI